MVFITNVDRVTALQNEYRVLSNDVLDLSRQKPTPAIAAKLDKLQSREQRIVAELAKFGAHPTPYRGDTNFFLAESRL